MKGASGAYSEQEEVVSEDMINNTVVGPIILSYAVNDSLASELKLFLHFSSKWIILSEIYFKTEKVNQPVLENRDEINKLSEAKSFDKELSDNIRQDMPLDDSQIIDEDSMNHLERKPIIHRQNSDFKQTYIGIGIGILGMAVILLVVIIYLVLRKNRHQIFSKHSSKFKVFFLLHCNFSHMFQFSKVP